MFSGLSWFVLNHPLGKKKLYRFVPLQKGNYKGAVQKNFLFCISISLVFFSFPQSDFSLSITIRFWPFSFKNEYFYCCMKKKKFSPTSLSSLGGGGLTGHVWNLFLDGSPLCAFFPYISQDFYPNIQNIFFLLV